MQIPPIFDDNPLFNALPVPVRTRLEAWVDHANALLAVENSRVLMQMAPSAIRGLFLRRGRSGEPTKMKSSHRVHFDFDYPADDPAMRRLYEKAKRLQWNSSTDLPWETDVDPMNPEVPLMGREFVDWNSLARRGVVFNKDERQDFLWRSPAGC